MYKARKRFWIIGLCRMAKTVTSKCVTCRKLRKRALNQLLGQIPNLRVVADFLAKSNTAVDMFELVQIKLSCKNLKEAYVIIFGCMTFCAIHLQLVRDKTSDAFLMAFWRFAGLCGCLLVRPWNKFGWTRLPTGNQVEVGIPRVKSVLSEKFGCQFRWE